MYRIPVVLISLLVLASCGLIKHKPPADLVADTEALQPAGKTREWLDRAKEGDAIAQYQLALCVEYGDRIERDLDIAFDWADESSLHGYPAGTHLVGKLYESGEGITQNKSKAKEYYKNKCIEIHYLC